MEEAQEGSPRTRWYLGGLRADKDLRRGVRAEERARAREERDPGGGHDNGARARISCYGHCGKDRQSNAGDEQPRDLESLALSLSHSLDHPPTLPAAFLIRRHVRRGAN